MNQIVETTLLKQNELFLTVRKTVVEQIAAAENTAKKARDSALAIEIDGQAMLDVAGRELTALATAIKNLDERRFEFTRPLDAEKTYIMDVFKGPKGLLEEGEKSLRTKVNDYLTVEREKAAKQRREIEEQERKDREAAVERERKAQAEADELATKAAAARSPAAKAKLTAQAEEATLRAQDATAAVELADIAPSRSVGVVAPRTAGIGTRGTWKVKSIDLAVLVKAAAADPQFLVYLEAIETKLNGIARALRADARVPGVVFYEDSGISVRTRS